jgi:Uma2 family endonuclease
MGITINSVWTVTDEDLLKLSERNPGYQFERTQKGELVVTPTGAERGRVSSEVHTQLSLWNRGVKSGVVFDSSTGFRLSDGSVLSPDASWVKKERWNALTPKERQGFGPFCPDAVFEILSVSQSLEELQKKMLVYLSNGARIGVLIDPFQRSVEIYRPNQKPQLIIKPTSVDLGPELSGFILNLIYVFES